MKSDRVNGVRHCPDCFGVLVISKKYEKTYDCPTCNDSYAYRVTLSKSKLPEKLRT